jgi:cyclopropane fatty-acyl-phospholipid synthase-like methyltransferase
LDVGLKSKVRFRCCNFEQVTGHKFEVVFASNLYQLLDIEDRSTFRGMINRNLKRNGMFFLSTLSISDPEQFGKGERIENESNSFRDEKFLHFCTREEIEKDFSFLSIKKLNEHEYYEPRSSGQTHHHISWILLGVNQ